MVAKAMEKRVSDLEEMVDDVPRLINVRFSFVRAQLDALDARIGTVEAKVDKLETRIAGLEAKVDALREEIRAMPRILAEMLDERERRGR
jgi:prefoldin subunit 5